MTVKRVDTLGCHPLLLMKKLAAVGGLEILKEEKHTYDDVDYPYRIVAKINDNLYIEAEDRLYRLAVTEEKLPSVFYGQYSCNSIKKMKLEATEEDKIKGVPSSKWAIVGIEGEPRDIMTSYNLSVLASLPVSSTFPSNQYHGIGLGGINSSSLPDVITTGELNEGEVFKHRLNKFFALTGELRDPATGFPFCIVNSGKNQISHPGEESQTGAPENTLCCTYSHADAPAPYPLVISSSQFRVAKTVSSENELSDPVDWDILPVFSSISSLPEGLVFSVSSTRGAFLVLSTINTSMEGVLEGTFPVVFKNIPLAYNPTSLPIKGCTVQGNESSPSFVQEMQSFAPDPPIPNDSISGGPVVSDVYIHNANEIRGTVPGVMSCSETIPPGTVGWLEGKRYRVVIPGLMFQIA